MSVTKTPLYASLIHLSFNMWEEHGVSTPYDRSATLDLCFDEELWSELLPRMVDAGFNAVVLDLGDAICYKSHPEIAVRNAWTPERLVEEVDRLRLLGLEFIPKLNFSAAHDTWLGPIYSRSLSTPVYYEVCRDLIEEVISLTHPRLFHLGMDEENYNEQQKQNFIAIRQNDLFWHDLLFLCGEVEKNGSRPWIWSDTIWENSAETFIQRMPRSVLQSFWYYGDNFESAERAAAYKKLDDAGFDQVPTCSCFYAKENPRLLAEHCRKVIRPKHLHGFLQTPWRQMIPKYRDVHLLAIEAFRDVCASDSDYVIADEISKSLIS